jgi:FlaA1/EpsC-like NDP-sugar epimerase
MKRSEIILMVLQVPIDFLLLVLAGVSAYYLRLSEWAVSLRPVMFDLSLTSFMNVVALVALSWVLIFSIFGLYSTNPNRKLASDLVKVILACSVGLGAIAVYVMFALQQFDSRFLVVAGWVLQLFIFVWEGF